MCMRLILKCEDIKHKNKFYSMLKKQEHNNWDMRREGKDFNFKQGDQKNTENLEFK